MGTDETFRSMWAEFEWENKVAISTSIPSLVGFLNHIVESTNMTCLTPYDQGEKEVSLQLIYTREVFLVRMHLSTYPLKKKMIMMANSEATFEFVPKRKASL